jgi:hypothetical protein
VVAAFDGGEITSDAAALLLGATDRALGLAGQGPAQAHSRRPVWMKRSQASRHRRLRYAEPLFA